MNKNIEKYRKINLSKLKFLTDKLNELKEITPDDDILDFGIDMTIRMVKLVDDIVENSSNNLIDANNSINLLSSILTLSAIRITVDDKFKDFDIISFMTSDIILIHAFLENVDNVISSSNSDDDSDDDDTKDDINEAIKMVLGFDNESSK